MIKSTPTKVRIVGVSSTIRRGSEWGRKTSQLHKQPGGSIRIQASNSLRVDDNFANSARGLGTGGNALPDYGFDDLRAKCSSRFMSLKEKQAKSPCENSKPRSNKKVA